MIEFIVNNWKEIAEIVVSLIVGILGGMKIESYRNKNISKIKGNSNIVNQGGIEVHEQKK